MNNQLRTSLDNSEKYQNRIHFWLAKIYRDLLRLRIRKLVSWSSIPQNKLDNGCTVIIGMCSKLPSILSANLSCLNYTNWDELKEILITVDAEKGVLPLGFEEEVQQKFPKLNIKFFYYNQKQAELTNKLKLPYIYSWLSWCICLKEVTTKIALIHDYDALVLGNVLEKRYTAFKNSNSKIQGIKWYQGNGLIKEDYLATTFEAFIDVSWVRSFEPIMLFNRISLYQGRSVDYDTLLDMQHNYTSVSDRQIVPMSLEELVHPSQVIHQYTMFRKFPGKKLPCFSIIMIPFFSFIGGNDQAINQAIQEIRKESKKSINLLGDEVQVNLSQLTTEQVDWILKQMIEVLVQLNYPPFKALFDYGTELYKIAETPVEQIWVGDFKLEHKQWIEAATKH